MPPSPTNNQTAGSEVSAEPNKSISASITTDRSDMSSAATEAASVDDPLTDLTLDDLNGDQNDPSIIEALTADDESVVEQVEAIELEEAELASEPEPEPTPPPLHPIRRDYPPSAMMDVTNEELERAFTGERAWSSSGVGGGGNADDIDELLRGLDDGTAPETAIDAPDESAPVLPKNPEGAKKILEIFKNDRAKKAAQKRERIEREDAEQEQKKADRKREQARARKQRERDRLRAMLSKPIEEYLSDLEAYTPEPIIEGRLRKEFRKRQAALERAIAAHPGDKFLMQIKKRVDELMRAWVILKKAINWHGPEPSLSKIMACDPKGQMTKDSVRRTLEILKKLEQPGRPWHGLG